MSICPRVVCQGDILFLGDFQCICIPWLYSQLRKNLGICGKINCFSVASTSDAFNGLCHVSQTDLMSDSCVSLPHWKCAIFHVFSFDPITNEFVESPCNCHRQIEWQWFVRYIYLSSSELYSNVPCAVLDWNALNFNKLKDYVYFTTCRESNTQLGSRSYVKNRGSTLIHGD